MPSYYPTKLHKGRYSLGYYDPHEHAAEVGKMLIIYMDEQTVPKYLAKAFSFALQLHLKYNNRL